MRIPLLALALCSALIAWFVLSLSAEESPKSKERAGRPERIENVEARHLPNSFRVHERVISGGLPHGEAGFRELSGLGVKTVISVDGAKPDVEAARKYGLRYVHLPHGYDGVPRERARELAKAVRDLPAPVYIHCHHGKHRSPVAAAVGCVAAGLLNPDEAVVVLKTAGTSEHYEGLYRSAADARPLGKAVLDALQIDFPETAKIPPMAEAMVEIEHAFDRLQQIKTAGWRSPPDHPDLEPAHEALLLREQFTELLRTPEAGRKPDEFRKLLQTSEHAGKTLEAQLRAWKSAGYPQPVPKRIGASFERIANDCTACHRKYRDVPLEEPLR